MDKSNQSTTNENVNENVNDNLNVTCSQLSSGSSPNGNQLMPFYSVHSPKKENLTIGKIFYKL